MSLPPVLLALQERLQHEFSDPQLLVQALTHRSFSADHNERLEFLGDSVLNLAVAHLLYEGLSTLPEGDLSRVRANLVKQDTLHGLALSLGLAEALRLLRGEPEAKVLAGGQSLLPTIGAVYLDAGYGVAQALVRRLFDGVEIKATMQAAAKDPKTGLQEWLQARKMRLPAYRVVETQGAAHQQTFDVECEIAELGLSERGIGGSRRAGEQAAAAAVLEILKTRNPR